MNTLFSPSDLGFEARLEAIDRCQIALLRQLSQDLGNRLFLKGGMAMRAVVGSLRLTKDIDFDRDGTISQDSLKRGLIRHLSVAASSSGIREAKVSITKDTATTMRARLEGRIQDNSGIRFDVEVSGREMPARENLRSVVVIPPRNYFLSSFSVSAYSDEVLAAMKIAAALSDRRNAPRDLFDLRALIRAGVNPASLLAKQSADVLQDFSNRALDKLEGLTFDLAEQELLPYLPPAERLALDADAWLAATLEVAQKIAEWCAKALAIQNGSAPSVQP